MNKIKVEAGVEEGYEVDVARERFESALNELLNKAELPYSDSENESNPDPRERLSIAEESLDLENGSQNTMNSILPHRPFRKKRRKENDTKDAGFHHTYVMRMFDRSVDLAQFEETAPLYPICRAWMINQPSKSEHKIKLDLSSDSQLEDSIDDSSLVTRLPCPNAWPLTYPNSNPRIPKKIPFPTSKRLDKANGELHVSPAVLLTDHLHRWRATRNEWKLVSQRADDRYNESAKILRSMFDRYA